MALERRLKLVTSEHARMTETAVKVAFATTDLKHVDQHFGAAESFAIYAVDTERSTMAEVVQFGQLDRDGNEDKLVAKIDALEGCIGVYCQAAGASAVNQLGAKNIQAMKVQPGSEIKALLTALQAELMTGPSARLARAIEQRAHRSSARFDDMEQEGWVE